MIKLNIKKEYEKVKKVINEQKLNPVIIKKTCEECKKNPAKYKETKAWVLMEPRKYDEPIEVGKHLMKEKFLCEFCARTKGWHV